MQKHNWVAVFVFMTHLMTSNSLFAALATQPSSMTESQWRLERVKWYKSALSEQFKLVGEHNPASDEIAIAFLDKMAEFLADRATHSWSRDPNTLEISALIQMADNAIKAGCKDPLVSDQKCQLLLQSERKKEFEELLTSNTPLLIQSKYNNYSKAFVGSHFNRLRMNVDTGTKSKISRESKRCLTAFLQSPITSSIERRMRFEAVTFHFSLMTDVGSRQDLGRSLISPKEPGDEWLRYSIGAWTALESLRSSSDNSNPEIIAKLAEIREKDEVQVLKSAQAAFAADSSLPQPAGLILELAVLRGKSAVPEPKTWFDRAKSAQFDYMPAWVAYSQILLPAHSGSDDQVYALGREAVESNRFDTAVPLHLITSLQLIGEGSSGNQAYWKKPGVWAAVSASLDGYVNAVKSEAAKRYYLSTKAAAGYLCGEIKVANRELTALKDDPDPEAFKLLALDVRKVMAEVKILDSIYGKEIEQAIQLEDKQDYSKASAAWSALLAKLGPNDKQRAYVLARSQICLQVIGLNQGKMARLQLTPEAGLIGWTVNGGNWNIAAGGVLESRSDLPATVSLVHNMPVPFNHMVALEVWIESDGNKGLPDFAIQLQDDAKSPCEILFHQDVEGKAVIALQRRGQMVVQLALVKLVPRKWNKVEVGVFEKYIRYAINTEGFTLPDPDRPDQPEMIAEFLKNGRPAVGLSAVHHVGSGVVKFRNITIRKVMNVKEMMKD